MNRILYEIDLVVMPDEERLSATATIRAEGTSSLRGAVFALHEALSITKASLDGVPINLVEEAKQAPFKPKSRLIKLPNEYDGRQVIIEYSGKISHTPCNLIRTDCIQLSDYAPWYPSYQGEHSSDFSVWVSGLDDHIILGASRHPERENNRWHYALEEASFNACNIIACKGHHSLKREVGGLSLEIHYYDADLSASIELLADIFSDNLPFMIREVFQSEPHGLVDGSFYVFSPPNHDSVGWGYCRTRLIVLPFIPSDEQELAAFLAHELAHIWAVGAPTNSWEDRLNESFAEYAACLYLERRFGHEAYIKQIDYYKRLSSDNYYRDIKTLDSAKPDGIHTQGTLMLDAMRESLGYNTVLEVMRLFASLYDKTTENLLVEVRKNVGEAAASFLSQGIERK